MVSTDQLGDEKYVLFTTFKRNGDPVSTPVWAAPLDGGGFGFWTSSGSGKAKRLAHTNRVTVQPCDVRGKVTPATSQLAATAELVGADDPRYAELQRKIKAKYGFMTTVTRLLGAIGGTVRGNRIPYGDRAVVVRSD